MNAVELGTLEPRTVFTLAGVRGKARPTYYELIEHAASSSVVRQVRVGEQIEFTRGDGTPVDFQARPQTERFSSATRVLVRVRA